MQRQAAAGDIVQHVLLPFGRVGLIGDSALPHQLLDRFRRGRRYALAATLVRAAATTPRAWADLASAIANSASMVRRCASMASSRTADISRNWCESCHALTVSRSRRTESSSNRIRSAAWASAAWTRRCSKPSMRSPSFR